MIHTEPQLPWSQAAPKPLTVFHEAFTKEEGCDVLVLVDGLGYEALIEHRGHTPFFRSLGRQLEQCSTVFPSTTATALASLFTGVSPLEHGIIGYEGLTHSGSINHLRGATGIQGQHWNIAPTHGRLALQAGRSLHHIGAPKYAASFLTRMLHKEPQWQFSQAAHLDEQARATILAARKHPRAVIYSHLPDIDKAGHRHGPGSAEWVHALEAVDAHLRRLAQQLPAGTRLSIFSDHGMVRANRKTIWDLATAPKPLSKPMAVAGEGRALMVRYAMSNHEGAVSDMLASLREWVGERGRVYSRSEMLHSGLLGGEHIQCETAVHERIGDALIVSWKRGQFTHSGFISPASLQQRGVHGALSDSEMLVPLVQLEAGR